MSGGQPFRDRVELGLIRLAARGLLWVDRLLNVRWGERLLDRASAGWQDQLAALDEALVQLGQERDRLEEQIEALSIHLAAVYLGGRQLRHGELRFDPTDPRDEELLDASIDLLVKKRLAAIETQEICSGHYVYMLEPDWDAIRQVLARAITQAEPENAEWYREGVRFIDENFDEGNRLNREERLWRDS
jgi:hypothetical protein